MATAIDAKGDLVAGTGADTFSRLAVGANNTVLTADSSTATGLKWATASGATGWTLLNSGGTTLTGATEITVSGLSAKELLVFVIEASSVNATSTIGVRINADSGTNYGYSGFYINAVTTYNSANIQGEGAYSIFSSFPIGRMADTAASKVYGTCYIDKADTTGWKLAQVTGGGDLNSQQLLYAYQGLYEASAAVTSITVRSGSGNFDGGTVYVLGAN
jgi:hypothetical protein